jgi:hypothetical protein
MNAPEKIQEGRLLLEPGGAQEVLITWFRTLQFRHTAAAHILIVDSLSWPELQTAFALAAPGGDFDAFALRVLQEARISREAGKVVASGIPRRKGGGRKPKHIEVRP